MNDIDAEISKLDGMIKSRVNELENQIKTAKEQIEDLSKKRIAFRTDSASEEKITENYRPRDEVSLSAEVSEVKTEANPEAVKTNEEANNLPITEKKAESRVIEHEKELKNPFETLTNARKINFPGALKWISSHEIVGGALIFLILGAVLVYKNFLLSKFSLEPSSLTNTLVLFSFFGLTIGIFWKLFQRHEPNSA